MNSPTEERAHALFSPSSAYTWIECAASVAAQIGQPDISSGYDGDGTATHELAKWCLESGNDAVAYIGRVIKAKGDEFEVDDDRAAYVQSYIDEVRDRIKQYELAGASVTMLVEQRLSIEHITGEKGAKGTSDCVLLAVWPDGRAEICVIDLKFEWGHPVVAERNYQAMIYAAAALEEHSTFMDFDRITIVIHQKEVTDWTLTTPELLEWIATVAKPAAERGQLYIDSIDFVPLTLGDFNPGAKQCDHCKGKAMCPAAKAFVEKALGGDLETIVALPEALDVEMLGVDHLGTAYPALPLIKGWIKAIEARIEYELLNGNVVPGVKLVQGRRVHRQWSSTDDAEALLKSMRLKMDEMYNFKLISPTQADKLLAKESPRRWKKVETLITQRDGSPSVAPESDKRPALVIAPPPDDFEVVIADEGDDLC